MRLDDFAVVVSAAVLLPATALRVSSSGLRGFERMLAEDAGAAASDAARARRICDLVDFAAHKSPFASTCLTRSLCKVRLLRARGYPALVRIGARLDVDAIDAHAWVEIQGSPVGDHGSAGFQPLLNKTSR